MARGINKVILVGNLGADPEVRYMPNGGAVANLRLATTDSWRDKQSGDKQERTEWHRVVLFGKLGEIAGEYLRKGSQVYVEGRIQTKKWQGNDGQDRYSTEIVASDMQMLGGGGAGGGGGGGRGSSADFNQDSSYDQGYNQGGSQPPAQSAPQQSRQAPPSQQAPQSQQAPSAPAGGGFDDFDDDIPF